MKLITIEKDVYRRRLNRAIIGFIAALTVLSLAFGAALIALFGDANVSAALIESGQQSSNFRFNFLGVLLALLACAAVLHQLKEKEIFAEIYYVWQLKQLQNVIYRRLKKIQQAAQQGNVDAFITLKFYYASQKQVYNLDDNTLTMSTLEKKITELDQQISQRNLTLSEQQFDKNLLDSFK